MGALPAQSVPAIGRATKHATTCHCGHCFTTIDVGDAKRRVRCPGCGRSNAIPHRVTVVCDRCHSTQRVRFDHRDREPPCASCGQALDMGAIELIPQHKRSRTSGRHHGYSERHESIVFTIMLYAIALILFLLWLGRG